MQPLSRRSFMTGTGMAITSISLSQNSPAAGNLADHGWCLEGQGIDVSNAPSSYGVGEGAEIFGLKKVLFMFHRNNELALEKLQPMQEVVCDITKWKSSASSYSGVQLQRDTRPMTVLEEAQTLSGLSCVYPHLKGAYLDQSLGGRGHGLLTPAHLESIQNTLRESDRSLHLWARVEGDELEKQDWRPFARYIDVIQLRIWNSENLRFIDRYIDCCQEQFLNKRIILACCLWDYSTQSPMSRASLELQWRKVLDLTETNRIAGYLIVATYLIDCAERQARWVRDFIAAN